MMDFVNILTALKNDRRAVTALEYGLIAAAVSVALIAAMLTFAPKLTAVFTTISSGL